MGVCHGLTIGDSALIRLIAVYGIFLYRIVDCRTIAVLRKVAVRYRIGAIPIVCHRRYNVFNFRVAIHQMYFGSILIRRGTDPILIVRICPFFSNADFRRIRCVRVGDCLSICGACLVCRVAVNGIFRNLIIRLAAVYIFRKITVCHRIRTIPVVGYGRGIACHFIGAVHQLNFGCKIIRIRTNPILIICILPLFGNRDICQKLFVRNRLDGSAIRRYLEFELFFVQFVSNGSNFFFYLIGSGCKRAGSNRSICTSR